MTSTTELISSVPAFANLPKKTIERFANAAVQRSYDQGTNIVSEGEAGVAMYIIADGTAAVTHPGEAEPRATLKTGASFGEMAVVDGGPRTATITAITPVTCLALPRWDFIAEVRGNGDFAMQLLEAMSARVRELEHRVAELETKA